MVTAFVGTDDFLGYVNIAHVLRIEQSADRTCYVGRTVDGASFTCRHNDFDSAIVQVVPTYGAWERLYVDEHRQVIAEPVLAWGLAADGQLRALTSSKGWHWPHCVVRQVGTRPCWEELHGQRFESVEAWHEAEAERVRQYRSEAAVAE
jgi:hypothetical protein